MISVTSLAAYEYCKRKLFLERVLRVTVPPKEALVRGQIRHQAYDKINSAEEELVLSITKDHTEKDIENTYTQRYSRILRSVILTNKNSLRRVNLPLTDAFKQIWIFFLREAQLRSQTVFEFIKTNKIYGSALWEKLTPKIKSEIRVQSPILKLKGIVDQIEVYSDHIVPVELKTGKAPKDGIWPGHKIQLGAYILMLNEMYSTNISEGYLHYLDIQERRVVKMNPFLKDEIIKLKDNVNLLLSTPNIPNKDSNENKCTVCSIKDICYDELKLKGLLREKFPQLEQKSLNQ
jgi:CRISPR-associated protein Cas4